MSIINQVLNELEQRGANAPLGEGAIRAVPPRRRSHTTRNLIAAALLLGLLAAVLWNWQRQASRLPASAVAPLVSASAVAAAPVAPASEAASAPVEGGASSAISAVAASAPVAAVHGKPLLLVASEDGVVAAPEAKKGAGRQVSNPATDNAGQDESAESGNPDLLKKTSPQQRAESEFLKANLAVQEGRTNDALKGYEDALLIDPTFKPARRAWVGALVSVNRNDQAEQVLRRGLKRDPHDAAFAMMLARLQVERDAVPEALETLQKTLPHALDNPDYRAFVAALMQRQGRHDEAVEHYRAALRISPGSGVWWMGLGISLHALQHAEEARVAYQRALATNSLNPQLQAFVQQKLKEL